MRLKDHGHDVINSALPDDNLDGAVHIAQAEFDQHHPDVIVGSSRGGATNQHAGEEEFLEAITCMAESARRL